MILNKQLKKLLTENDTTVAQLARATKISSKTIYSWINGQSARDLDSLKNVSDHFNVSLDYLVFGIDEKNQKKTFVEFQDEINTGVFEVILRRPKAKI